MNSIRYRKGSTFTFHWNEMAVGGNKNAGYESLSRFEICAFRIQISGGSHELTGTVSQRIRNYVKKEHRLLPFITI